MRQQPRDDAGPSTPSTRRSVPASLAARQEDGAALVRREVDAVVLDYGNVLYAWDPYGAVAGVVPVRAWNDFVRHGGFARWNEMADAGDDLDEIAARLAAAHPDRPDWLATYRTYLDRFGRSLLGPVPGSAQLVRDLHEAGVPLYLLSNFHDRLFTAHADLCPELALMDGMVVSGEVGLTKPDPRVFTLTLERFALEASRTLFVDDSAPNIAAAASLGIRTHHFTAAGRLRAELADLGLVGPAA